MGLFVHGHPAACRSEGAWRGDGKGEGLVALHLPGSRRGRGIRRYRLHSLEALRRARVKRTHAGATSAGTEEGGKGLRQQGGLLFHQFGFGHPQPDCLRFQ